MTLRLYNTLTKTKEDFEPDNAANVRMYVCGPTVYDFAHIGNARPVIVFDVLFRLLRHLYGADHVTYVRNITDVDDKINARAAERGITIRELTEETARIFNEDVAALGCLPPTVTPRATDNIAQMIAMIETLVANGHAYPAEGHVLFDVSSKPDYGKLARRSLDEMMAGARVDVAPYKKSPMDFVLWKPSDAATPGWESPWGRGRPGWHIECSAMAGRYLGESFDIHGGGIDLVFPHHENEIAQSEAAHHGHPLAKVWMHNGFLQVEGEKMAKSAGNFVTIRDLLPEWPGDALRFNMLKTHYRQPIDWTKSGLMVAFDEYYDLLDVAERYDATSADEKFVEYLSDDLNTPRAIMRLHEVRELARAGDISAGASLRASLRLIGLVNVPRDSVTIVPQVRNGASASEIVAVFASRFPRNLPVRSLLRALDRPEILNEFRPEVGVVTEVLRNGDPRTQAGDVERLSDVLANINDTIDARTAARARKDFKESDRIRDELLARGIVLKDGPNGTTWEVKR
jgi:cysteinyl-tRNA synthetase